MIYVSNLAAGLEKGLDHPSFLLEAAAPFGGEVGIELFLHYHDEAYRRRAQNAAEWLGGLPRTAHGPFLQVEATAEQGSAEQAYLFEAYGWAFETAQRLECRDMVFHTHQRVVWAQEKERAQHNCMRNLEVLLAMGEKHGVRLLIENLGIQRQGISLFDEEDFCRLAEAFPQAGCLIDTGHLNVAGWNVERVLERLSGRICGYHLHNNDGVADSHRPIDEGTFDYAAFYKLYRRFTPKASLTLEYADGGDVTPPRLSGDVQKVIDGVSGL